MVSIVVARFYKGNYHTMITTTDCSHIVSRLPTSTCIMVPIELLGKKPEKTLVQSLELCLFFLWS
jgi:hypothetical protein